MFNRTDNVNRRKTQRVSHDNHRNQTVQERLGGVRGTMHAILIKEPTENKLSHGSGRRNWQKALDDARERLTAASLAAKAHFFTNALKTMRSTLSISGLN
jgi:hypothetical protein